MKHRPDRFGWQLLAFSLGISMLAVPAGARGDLWTNAAGHAVEVTLLSVSGDTANFKLPDGTHFSMPLASLSPAAKQQVLKETGQIVVPEILISDFGLCVRTLERLGELQQAGKLGDADYAVQREAALARLKKAFARLNVPEASRERLLLLARNH